MEKFTFCSPTEFIFGRGTQKEIGSALARHGATRVMIVYGSDRIERSGLLAEITDSLRSAGIEYVTFGGVKPNPTAANVRDGIEKARAEKIDFLLAVGGGSPIDAAKGMAIGVPYPGDFWDFYDGHRTPETALPVGVVLTIPAAGSEGSGNSVITLSEGKIKISLRTDFVLRPKFALLNPELTFTLPPTRPQAA